MPTYVYECAECEHRFEVFQSFTAKAMRKCPQCRRTALRKVLFPAGVVFKGSGFYVNDSRATAKAGAKKDAPAASDGSAADGKSDGKKDGGSPDSKSKGESSPGKTSGKKPGDTAPRKEPAASGSKSGS